MKVLRLFYFIMIIFIFPTSMYLQDLDEKPEQPTDSEKINSYFQKGVLLYIQRDFKNATLEWKKVLEMEPSHQKAKVYFERAFSKYQEMETNFYLGLDNFDKGKCQLAIDYFKKTLLINPRHKKALYYYDLANQCLQVHLVIQDQPSPDGKKINNIELTTDDLIQLYAIAYDKLNRYIGPTKVKWETTGSLDPIPGKEKTMEIAYSPKTYNTEGTILAHINEKNYAETGLITVKIGQLKYVKIFDNPYKKGKEIHSLKMTADDSIKLYAAGFDSKNQYIGEVPVNWNSQGSIDILEEKNSTSFPFQSTKAGKGKIIVLPHTVPQVIISNIIITPGKLKYLQIENSPYTNSKEIYSFEMNINETAHFYTLGYDQYFNRIGNIKADWATTGTLEPQFKKQSLEFSFTPKKANTQGTIKATRKDIPPDETGLIRINEIKMAYVVKTNKPQTEIETKSLPLPQESMQKEKKVANLDSRDIVLYIVYNGDTFCKIMSKILQIPYSWDILKPYVYALGDYNHISDINLIFPKQEIRIPYIQLEKESSKRELSKLLFNNDQMMDKIKIYNKNNEKINSEDKIIIIHEEFLRTGSLSTTNWITIKKLKE